MSNDKLNSLRTSISETNKKRRFHSALAVSLFLTFTSVSLFLGQGANAKLQLPSVDEINRAADAGLRLPSVCEITESCKRGDTSAESSRLKAAYDSGYKSGYSSGVYDAKHGLHYLSHNPYGGKGNCRALLPGCYVAAGFNAGYYKGFVNTPHSRY